MKNAFLFFSILLALCLSSYSYAKQDPKIDWKLRSSKNFDILYASGESNLAQDFLNYAEESHEILIEFFKDAPEKTLIVLLNNTDASNGSATSIPYPYIQVFPKAPTDLDSIYNFGNWPRELVLHEYTHILALSPRYGFAKYFANVFGGIIRPNALLSRWYHEGLAVEMESRFSNHGRLNSKSYDALLRNFVAHNQLKTESIDRINESSIPTWPLGARPYFFGAYLWHELNRENNLKNIFNLNYEYASQLPITSDRGAKNILGLKYYQLLDNTYSRIEKQKQQDIENYRFDYPLEYNAFIQRKPMFKRDGVRQYGMLIHPSKNYLYYLNDTENFETELIRVEFSNPKDIANSITKVSRIDKGDSILQLNLLADDSIVYEKLAIHQRYYNFSDLFIYNPKNKKIDQITEGARARYSCLNPDSTKLYFISDDSQYAHLNEYNIANKAIKKLFRFENYQRPAWLVCENSNSILFTQKSKNQNPKLARYLLEQNKYVDIPDSPDRVYQIKKYANNYWAIIENNKAKNLYVSSDLKNWKEVSNSFTELVDFTYNPKTDFLYISELNLSGPKFYQKTWKQKTFTAQNFEFSKSAKFPDYESKNKKYELGQESDYSAWRYMFPKYWMPFIYGTENSTVFSASTSVSDPLLKHNYALLLQYDTLNKELGHSLSYLNMQSQIDWSIESNVFFEYLEAYEKSLKRESQILSFYSYIYGLSEDWRSAFYFINKQDSQKDLDLKHQRQGAGLQFSFSNLDSITGYKISPLSGQSLILSHTYFFKSNKNLEYSTSQLMLDKYWHTDFIAKNHSLRFKFSANYEEENKRSLALANTNFSIQQNSANHSDSPDYGDSSMTSSASAFRGYLDSNFLYFSNLMASMEYSFPFMYHYSGLRSFPLFYQKSAISLFTDAASFDGAYIKKDTNTLVATDLEDVFLSVGIEYKIFLTLFYHAPLNISLGYAYGLDQEAGGISSLYFGISSLF